MKSFISSCAVLIVVILIIEIFCPAKVMKKSLYMAFSLIMLVVIIGGIKNIFTGQEIPLINELGFKLEISEDSILNESAIRMENQISVALESSGIVVKDIQLDYYIDELSIVFESASVEIEEESKKNKAIEIVKEVTGLTEKEIDVWVSS